MLNKLLNRLLDPLMAFLYFRSANWLRSRHPEWHHRRWSNREIKRWGTFTQGDVINVSGWQDSDKEGGSYADYFPHRTSYTISNISGKRGWAETSNHQQITLDLTAAPDAALREKYDVVFNHTTLEHIYDIQLAVTNLCHISRDMVMVVVPFMQPVHWEPGSYLDFWRPTPFALAKMFEDNNFEIVYWSSNDNPVGIVYLFCIAVRDASKWRSVFPPLPPIQKNNVPGVPGYYWYQHRIPPVKREQDS